MTLRHVSLVLSETRGSGAAPLPVLAAHDPSEPPHAPGGLTAGGQDGSSAKTTVSLICGRTYFIPGTVAASSPRIAAVDTAAEPTSANRLARLARRLLSRPALVPE
jgi:hypothetical protein